MCAFSRLTGWQLACACLAAVIQVEANKWEQYKFWLQEQKGFQFSTVSVLEDANGGRGLIATEAFTEDNLILKLPISAVFSEEAITDSVLEGLGCDKDPRERFDHMESRSRFSAAFLLENGTADSSWRQMLDNIPQDLDVPGDWQKPELGLLRGSGISLQVARDRYMLEREYGHFVDKCPEFGRKFTASEFVKAGAILASRGNVGGGEEANPAIIPFIDLANHDENPNAELGALPEDGIYALVSTRSIREGEEITIAYSDVPGDISHLTKYGFFTEANKKVARSANLILPGCIPPSLLKVHDRIKREQASKGEDFQGFSPELRWCCKEPKEAMNKEDKYCYNQQLANLEPTKMFQYVLGPILTNGVQSPDIHQGDGSLAELFTRLRTLVVDSGIIEGCEEAEMEMDRPVSLAGELLVMRLLKSLINAHMDQSGWAVRKGVLPPPPANKASKDKIELVRKVHIVERGVLQWYLGAIAFIEQYLELPTNKELQKKLCEDMEPLFEKKVKKGKIEGIAKYTWLVDHVLAPLAFVQKFEKDTPCGARQAVYKIKPKECRAVLKGGLVSLGKIGDEEKHDEF